MAIELESNAQPKTQEPPPESTEKKPVEQGGEEKPALIDGINKEQLERAAQLLRDELLPEKKEPEKKVEKPASDADRVSALEAELKALRAELQSDRNSTRRESVVNKVKNSGEYRAINAYGEEAMSAVHQVMEDAAKTGKPKTWQQAAEEVEKYLLERFKAVAPVLNGQPTLTNGHSGASAQVDYGSMPRKQAYAAFAKDFAKAF